MMPSIAPLGALLLAALLGVSGCAARVPDKAACNSYLRTFDDKGRTWRIRSSPPTDRMNAAVARLSRDLAENAFLKSADVVWYENAKGDLGVCTIAECPRGFFVYAAGALDQQPVESRISASCGVL